MLSRFRANYANVAASLALIAALGGTAIAANSAQNSSSKTVFACAAKKGKKKGLLRNVSKAKCKKGERLISWNKQGPAGTPGQPGAAGAAGAAGGRGPTGPQGPPGTSGSEASAPAHSVMAFNLAACPSGWTEFTAARGRYLVGLSPAGTLAGTIGTALNNLENRPTGRHTHDINDPGHTHSIKVNSILNGGNVTPLEVQGTADEQPNSIKATLPAQAMLATTGITIQPAGLVEGTNAPYVQLLVCEKS